MVVPNAIGIISQQTDMRISPIGPVSVCCEINRHSLHPIIGSIR